MLSTLLKTDYPPNQERPREGDLFKHIELHGKTFEIRYGFYEDCDRHTRFAEPMPCYPDFLAEPQYTDNGIPYVTAIQDVCRHFVGQRDENSTCGDCAEYRHGDEMLGLCAWPKNKRNG